MKMIKLILDCFVLLISIAGGFLHPLVWIVTLIQAVTLAIGFWEDYKTNQKFQELQAEHNRIPEVQGQRDLDRMLRQAREAEKREHA